MEKLPKRKQLRLKGYDYSQSGAYFVTICTQHRQHLFGEIAPAPVGAHPCVRPDSASPETMHPCVRPDSASPETMHPCVRPNPANPETMRPHVRPNLISPECQSPESPSPEQAHRHAQGCPNKAGMMIERWLFALEGKYDNTAIDHYVIMPDHLHFILIIKNAHIGAKGTHIGAKGAHIGAPLPEMIQWFKTQTTNEYIRGVRAGDYPPFEGHIWQRNYFEHIVRNEQDLAELRSYIHENPIKWALLKSGKNR